MKFSNMITLEEAAKEPGITRWDKGLRLHFSPIPNWYACIIGLICPICDNHINWEWDWEGPLPVVTNRAPRKSPEVTGAKLEDYGHRYIALTCNECGTKLFAENFD